MTVRRGGLLDLVCKGRCSRWDDRPRQGKRPFLDPSFCRTWFRVGVYSLAGLACGPAAMPALGVAQDPRAPASVGVDPAVAKDASPSSSAHAPWESWGIPADFRTTYRRIGEPHVSRGHGVGRLEVTVYANPVAARTFGTRHAPFEEGSLLVADHKDSKGREGPLFAMRRRESSAPGGPKWDYAAFLPVRAARDPSEGLAPNARCAACHKDALRDEVFSQDGSSSPGPEPSSVKDLPGG